MRASIPAIIFSGLAALAAAAPQSAVTAITKFECPAEPSEELKAVAAKMAEEEEAARKSGSVSIQAPITVQTYFHVVARSTSAADGYLSDQQLQQQLAVMNSDFGPQEIQFVLAGTDKTVNAQWAAGNNEAAMKQALRKGTYSTLNVYFLGSLTQYLGVCYFPEAVNPTILQRDGCLVYGQTAPGGSATNYNLGKTATHEIGHWFGLFHTFQGQSCSGSGDFVADTPQQRAPTSGCPRGIDTCPNSPGLDPINNFMDYSYDSCYETFTAGQKTRAHSMFNQFRAGK